MVKKILFAALVLLAGMAGDCFADVSAQFEQAAAYERDGNWQQAEQIYKDIILANPATDYALGEHALKAQRKLVDLYVSMKNQTDVETALDKLVADFSSYLHLPGLFWYIGKRYETAERFEGARAIYSQLIRSFPDTPQADRARKAGIPKVDIVLLIQAGKEAAAAIDKLAAELSASAYRLQYRAETGRAAS